MRYDLIGRAHDPGPSIAIIANRVQPNAPAPTVEILPPALAAFQKAFPRVRVLLHDLSEQELIDGLRNGRLELAMMPGVAALQSGGLEYEAMRSYPICVALAPTRRLASLKSMTLEKVAAEPLIGFNRKDYPEYYVGLDRIIGPLGIKPRFVVECDSASSFITEIETGRSIAIASPVLRHASGKRLLYRPLMLTLSFGVPGSGNGSYETWALRQQAKQWEFVQDRWHSFCTNVVAKR